MRVLRGSGVPSRSASCLCRTREPRRCRLSGPPKPVLSGIISPLYRRLIPYRPEDSALHSETRHMDNLMARVAAAITERRPHSSTGSPCVRFSFACAGVRGALPDAAQ